ncbi:hypothetical protein HHL21_17410 [Massilia sp. RP-1-19]|uniref:ATP-grasp domain-containing protein n=2 Tax=Massilia polaris TaxID=2728846 RepID=A0A848HNH8_9BURK|nr:hypothetical protein [Massilia polaris]
MSKNHWQIAKRDAGGQAKFGAARAVPLDEVPADLLAYAVAAANLIGDGLYGVDMKMTARGPVVIEVNDNPNIDAGNEDSVLGNDMYRIVLRDLVRRLDNAHGAQVTIRQNEVVKRLAGWGAILAVPTMVFSLYGMNFDVMPELKWRWSYPTVMLGIVAVSAYLHRRLKRAAWL